MNDSTVKKKLQVFIISTVKKISERNCLNYCLGKSCIGNFKRNSQTEEKIVKILQINKN